ncbi:MAG: histone deacetylase family protein [Leptolyngbyaceae cyanobacterium]
MLSVIYSDDFLLHDTGSFHPEQPGRVTAIRQALLATPWADQIDWQPPTPVEQRDVIPMVRAIHSDRYIEALRQLADRGGGNIDADTILSPRSFEVALLAVSAWLDGVDRVLHTGEPAFVLARPPGHHALPEIGMGFCIFGNAAIAAYYALGQAGVERVAILDWDVHHGNGTQAMVQSHPHIAYCSLHEFPHYPGTGAASEHGQHHNVLNIPMPAGSSLKEYELAFQQQVMPFLTQFQLDLLIVSAGYDANQDDPLSHIALHPQDFGVFTRYCLQLTDRILFGLEGGYDLKALAQSVVETLAACLT